MKKIFIFYLLIESTFILSAQNPFTIKEGEASIIYSLPKTEFCIEVQTEKVTQKPGIFYRYSERYLATNKVITERKTTFRLKDIHLKSQAVPDPNRTYSFLPSKKSEASHISINSKGILSGVNVPFQSETVTNEAMTENQIENSTQTALLPLGEEYMMAGSEAKLAEGAAKQIYRIRESRLGLLTADVEKLPSDGASFKSMLEGLNKMEKELTELFIGTSTSEIQTQKIYLTPDSAVEKQVLFRLSALLGVVSTDDLSGIPYYISIKPTIVASVAADPKAKLESVEIYTILPASTQVSIGDGINTLYSGQFYVPQFGKTIPLAKCLLQKPKVIIRIDPQTGRLFGIE
ncbi:MAG: DUF4831 family protein [Paludibacter sp.]